VRLGGAGARRRALADGGAADDQRGLLLHVDRLHQRAVDRIDVVAVDRADHVPAIGHEALAHVVAVPRLHGAVDRDAVVVVQRGQLVELPHAGQRAGFVADAFHHAAVTHHHVGAVVDDRMTGPIKAGGEQLLGQRHAHRVGQALAERPGGGFHAGRDADLGMARCLAEQLAKVAQLLDGQVIAGEVKQRVEQHRAVAVAQHETVAVDPRRVERVVLQVPAPQRHRRVGQAHRCARMPGVGLLHGVHRQGADGIGHQPGFVGVGARHVWVARSLLGVKARVTMGDQRFYRGTLSRPGGVVTSHAAPHAARAHTLPPRCPPT
jgi:hypothetical protein